jgi:hypothetical protein
LELGEFGALPDLAEEEFIGVLAECAGDVQVGVTPCRRFVCFLSCHTRYSDLREAISIEKRYLT